VIGFVLAPIAEKKLGAGLQASNGSWWPLLAFGLLPSGGRTVYLSILAQLSPAANW
jgi:hypothetical protein